MCIASFDSIGTTLDPESTPYAIEACLKASKGGLNMPKTTLNESCGGKEAPSHQQVESCDNFTPFPAHVSLSTFIHVSPVTVS